MDSIPEVIFTSSKNKCTAYDPITGNVVHSYKTPQIAPKTLALIGEDYLIGAFLDKPLMKVWMVSNVKKEESEYLCAGMVTALAVSRCGSYCVGGIKEEIRIWEVSTGELLNVISQHYQDITCLRFSSDDSHFLSGGKDGRVIVWILSQVLAVDIDKGLAKPRFVWNHHSAEVTDIFVGSLGYVARIATTSLDMTCKVYELDSGVLLSTICMDVPLTAVVMDTLEYYIFLGDMKGCISRVNTYERLPKELHSSAIEKCQYQIHDSRINSLSVSIEGLKIVSSSDDKTCKVWDIQSMACLLTLPHEERVTNAFFAMEPAVFSDKRILPQFYVSHFGKEMVPENKDVQKYKEPALVCTPLTLMHEGSPDPFYSAALLRGSVKSSVQGNTAAINEEIFQEAIHGETVNELRTVNNYMYSYMIQQAMDKLPGDFPSDSD